MYQFHFLLTLLEEREERVKGARPLTLQHKSTISHGQIPLHPFRPLFWPPTRARGPPSMYCISHCVCRHFPSHHRGEVRQFTPIRSKEEGEEALPELPQMSVFVYIFSRRNLCLFVYSLYFHIQASLTYPGRRTMI